MNKIVHWYETYGRPILVGGGLGVFCALMYVAGVFSTASSRLNDRLYLSRPADGRIAIVAIDDQSISKIGRWPWNRTVHADLIRKLTQAGASIIAYDVNFSEAQNGEADADLASAIRESNRIILPTELSISLVDDRLVSDPKDIIAPQSIFADAALKAGFSNTPPDGDGVVRSLPLFVFSGGERSEMYAFSFEAAQAFDNGLSVANAPIDRLGRIMVAYPGMPKRSYPTVSAADVLDGQFDESLIKGKLVFVGSTAPDLHDEQMVPTSESLPMSGVEIHASFADTLLQRRWIHPVSTWMLVLALILIGIVNGWIVSRFKIWWSIAVEFLMFACAVIFAVVSFEIGLVINVLWVALTLLITFFGVTIERRMLSERDRKRIRSLFEHYVSPSIVDAIIRDPSKIKLIGERREASILFSDIRVFTAMTETTPPELLIQRLDRYFADMTEEIFKQNGVLDKYMGDGLMAFWNAPFDQSDHALRAVEAALAMQKRLDNLNRKGALGNPAWRVGIGINSGEVIIGNIGGEKHADYTAIGDPVNLASRVESLTREYNVGIIITEATAKQLQGRMLLRRLDHVTVKGRYQSITLYEVMCELADATADQKELVELYEKMLDLYAKGDFDEVIYQCRQILMKYPQDQPTLLLNERARSFLNEPPPMGWDGTWVYTAK